MPCREAAGGVAQEAGEARSASFKLIVLCNCSRNLRLCLVYSLGCRGSSLCLDQVTGKVKLLSSESEKNMQGLCHFLSMRIPTMNFRTPERIAAAPGYLSSQISINSEPELSHSLRFWLIFLPRCTNTLVNNHDFDESFENCLCCILFYFIFRGESFIRYFSKETQSH